MPLRPPHSAFIWPPSSEMCILPPVNLCTGLFVVFVRISGWPPVHADVNLVSFFCFVVLCLSSFRLTSLPNCAAKTLHPSKPAVVPIQSLCTDGDESGTVHSVGKQMPPDVFARVAVDVCLFTCCALSFACLDVLRLTGPVLADDAAVEAAATAVIGRLSGMAMPPPMPPPPPP